MDITTIQDVLGNENITINGSNGKCDCKTFLISIRIGGVFIVHNIIGVSFNTVYELVNSTINRSYDKETSKQWKADFKQLITKDLFELDFDVDYICSDRYSFFITRNY